MPIFLWNWKISGQPDRWGCSVRRDCTARRPETVSPHTPGHISGRQCSVKLSAGGTIVRIPVHLHDRMHKLSVYREPGTAVSYDALSRRVAAEEKNGKTINETEIKEILCKVEPMVSLRSLNETMKLDGETERQEMVTDPEIPTPDEEVGDRLFLASCLEQLTPRERQVIAMRYGLENCERMTLMEIGGKLHITKERVRQLEQRAMEKMRAFSRS